jgi:hypothetical protein
MTQPRVDNAGAAPRTDAKSAGQAGVETMYGARPSFLNAQTAHALTSAVLAAFVILAARFRSELSAGQLDLIASGLRVAALAFVLRALIDFARFARALVGDRVARSAQLVLTPDELVLRVAGEEQRVRRDEVLGISAQETLPTRTLPARPDAIALTLTPRGGKPRVVFVPPYFAPTSEIALARLTRWRGAAPDGPAREPNEELAGPIDDAVQAPDAHYERAASGSTTEPDVVIPEGRGYLLRAPYTALLGMCFALDVFFSAGTSRLLIATPVVAACALSIAVLVAWFAWITRKRKSRRGIGMLLTRAELLLRGPHGVVAVPWAQLASTELRVSARWSPFVGSYAVRVLTLGTNTGERMIFDQSFLGVPLEVVEVLCRHAEARVAQRKARVDGAADTDL